MKKAVLLIQDLYTVLTREAKTALVTVLCLSLSISVSFSMMAYCSKYMGFLDQIAEDKATYKFYFSIPDPEDYAGDSNLKTPIEAFDALFFGEGSPKARESYDDIAFFLYPDENKDEKQSFWQPYFDNAFALGRDRSEEITAGRWFTETDTLAAVVSEASFPGVKPGAYITVLGQDLEVIGTLEEDNFLPYRFMLEASDSASGFAPAPFSCTFTAPMTAKQLQQVRTGALLSITSRYEIRAASYATTMLLILALAIGIFLIIMLNMRNLFQHMILQDRYRFLAIRLCGGSRGFVFCGLYLVPLLLTAVSYGLGLLLHLAWINPVLIRSLKYPALGAMAYGVAFLLTLGFAFLVLLPSVQKIVKAQPADASLWR